MKTLTFILLSLFIFINANYTRSEEKQQKPKVQIALLLDTSNSMDGLIQQAKTQLWKIVNEMATAKYNGMSPDLEIALYEYGNDNLTSAEGFVRLVSKLTGDLDAISAALFDLKTNGGEEYCGVVIDKAVKQLEWSKSNADLKLIFIAGNEPFNQGAIDYKESCKKAVTNGIVVNTIFCGNLQEGISTLWKDGADRADGKYMNINQDMQTAEIETPFDDTIIRLNEQLNKTYIGFGKAGEAMEMRQEAQDANAAQFSKGVSVNRAITKSSANYKNSNWDLVDASKDKTVKIEEVAADDLPDEMKNMSNEEKKKFIDNKSKERDLIQSKIKTVTEKRTKYINEQQKANAEKSTLDEAMIKTVREQAKKKNYIFK